MEYFVYISDSKLEMLYEQIPWSAREQLSYELSLNFGVVKARFANASHDSARSHKLKLVERFLAEKTGTVFDPSSFFWGEMDMIWGPYKDYDNLVYFGGWNEYVHVGLGGTLTNCIGVSKESGETTSYSLSPYLVAALAKKGEIPDPHKRYTSRHGVRELNEWAMKAVVESNQTLMLPVQRLKFFAKKIAFGNVDKRGSQAVLIGSPIYVAAADDRT